MGPPTPYVTWGEFVTNLLKTKPELTGKVIGMPAPAIQETIPMDFTGGHVTILPQAGCAATSFRMRLSRPR